MWPVAIDTEQPADLDVDRFACHLFSKDNVEVDTRPLLTVGSVTSPNPVTILTYRFEVSPNATFDRDLTVMAVGAVPSVANGTTSVVSLPPELALATNYYWRAQAIDAARGVASPFSATAAFSTYAPRAGVALLHVSPTTCNSGWPVTIDSQWTSDEQHARFTTQSGFDPGLRIELSRTSTGWTGVITGDGVGRAANELMIYPADAGATLPVQAVAGAARWTGSFDGAVGIWNRYHDGGVCGGSFTWVMLPPPS